MILAIDAGNSRVKWGWLEGEDANGPRWSSMNRASARYRSSPVTR